MTTRTTMKTVTFTKPFTLGGLDEVLPAGNYCVETDEELLEGLSFPAYRRKLTALYLREKSGRPGFLQILTIDPNELDAALKRDEAMANAWVNRGVDQSLLPAKTVKARQEERSDRQALHRAENEGMILHRE